MKVASLLFAVIILGVMSTLWSSSKKALSVQSSMLQKDRGVNVEYDIEYFNGLTVLGRTANNLATELSRVKFVDSSQLMGCDEDAYYKISIKVEDGKYLIEVAEVGEDD